MFVIKRINDVGYKRFTNKNNLKSFPVAVFNIYCATIFISGCISSIYEVITNENDNIVNSFIIGGLYGTTLTMFAPIVIPIVIVKNVRHKLNE